MSGISEETLMNQLRNQIEFYFGDENLARDSYLQSMLHSTDHLGAVPVASIAAFPKIKQIWNYACTGEYKPADASMMPADAGALVRSIRGSSVVLLSDDGHWLRPIRWKPMDSPMTSPTVSPTSFDSVETATVQVFDMPNNLWEQALLDAFTTGEVRPLQARLDTGNVWNITFQSEEDANAGLTVSRGRHIDGVPIRAQFKGAPQPIMCAPSRLPPQHHQRQPPPQLHGYSAIMTAYPQYTYGIHPHGAAASGAAGVVIGVPCVGIPQVGHAAIVDYYPPTVIGPHEYPPQQVFVHSEDSASGYSYQGSTNADLYYYDQPRMNKIKKNRAKHNHHNHNKGRRPNNRNTYYHTEPELESVAAIDQAPVPAPIPLPVALVTPDKEVAVEGTSVVAANSADEPQIADGTDVTGHSNGQDNADKTEPDMKLAEADFPALHNKVPQPQPPVHSMPYAKALMNIRPPSATTVLETPAAESESSTSEASETPPVELNHVTPESKPSSKEPRAPEIKRSGSKPSGKGKYSWGRRNYKKNNKTNNNNKKTGTVGEAMESLSVKE